MGRQRIDIEIIDEHNAAIRAFNRLKLAKVDLYMKGKKINLTPFRIKAIDKLLCMDNNRAVEMRVWKRLPTKAPKPGKTKK